MIEEEEEDKIIYWIIEKSNITDKINKCKYRIELKSIESA